jgi:hypothetical protein
MLCLEISWMGRQRQKECIFLVFRQFRIYVNSHLSNGIVYSGIMNTITSPVKRSSIKSTSLTFKTSVLPQNFTIPFSPSLDIVALSWMDMRLAPLVLSLLRMVTTQKIFCAKGIITMPLVCFLSSIPLLCISSSLGSTDWLHNIADEDLRYLPFNGGVSSQQLEWLESQLLDAVQNNERCLLFSHMAIYRPASQEQNLLWNSEEILNILHTTPKGTVVSFISGHDHDGGFATDSHGIHHIVPCSPIECDEGEMSFGVFEIYANERAVKIDWTGKLPPRVWGESLDLP